MRTTVRNLFVMGLFILTSQSLVAQEDSHSSTFPVIAGNHVDAEQFLAYFNQYRAKYGLPPVQLSIRLTKDAANNNSWQHRRGIGHHYMGSASAQNSAAGQGSIGSVMRSWHNSSGHRQNMMRRSWRCMGIHRSGRYWTQNFSAWSDCQ